MSSHNLTDHRAKKRFGQNFLVDHQVIHRIIKAINPQSEDQLIEIGPGLGALTQYLISKTPTMTAIELDRDLAKHLRSEHPSLTLIEADALKVDFQTLLSFDKKNKITGNLPYNISTPLLFHLLKNESHIDEMYFMLQKEVVDRLAAKPHTKAYGRLTVMVQYHCSVEPLLMIPPHAFKPAPKVHSAFVSLIPKKDKLPLISFSFFEKIVNAAFQQRRKTLRNALSFFIPPNPPPLVQNFLSLRAEALSPSDYVLLANTLHSMQDD